MYQQMLDPAMPPNVRCNVSMHPKLVQQSLEEAMNMQQDFYELSADWNYYEKNEHEYLKLNIRYSIFGAPELETENGKAKPISPEYEQIIDTIYNKILEASRSRDSLYVGIIFNVLCNIDEKEKKVSPTPIFKVKRCMEREDLLRSEQKGSTKTKEIGETALYPCCVYYIDPEARVYKNWTDYVESNTLPKCMMVLPMGGFYQPHPHANETEKKSYVWLEIGPSVSVKKQILSSADVASTVLGFGALGVGVAALAAPLAAPILVAGTICGAVSGAYATGRSTQQLLDRHKHQQSISVGDRTARSAWLGVAGGVAGGLASGSTFLLSKAARAGVTLGTVTRTTYNTITIGNIVINGMGIGNGVYSIYKNYDESKEFSVLEISQVMAHILFFGNAVMKFQTAKTIITNTQQQVLQEYEQSLRSKRHRKAFNRIKRNTQVSRSDRMTADSEIIRGIRSIQNRDDFFAGVVRNRKIFNAANAEVTFKDGYAMINDNFRFDPIELSQQAKDVRFNTARAAEPFVEVTKYELPKSNKMEASTFNTQYSVIREMLEPVLKVAQAAFTIDKARYLGRLILDLKDFCNDDRKDIIQKVSEMALEIVRRHRRFVNESVDEIMYFMWNTFIRPKVDKHLREMSVDVSLMEKFPPIAHLVHDTIVSVINEIYDRMENLLENIITKYSNRNNILEFAASEPVVCSVCSGYVLQN